MNALNFKPAVGASLAGDKTVAVPALDAGASIASTSRSNGLGRMQRRRLNATRLQLEDNGFRLFRVY